MSMAAVSHSEASTPPVAETEKPWYAEEWLNQITHGFGLVLSVLGAISLGVVAAQTQEVWRVRGVVIYGTTLVALYAASTLSHSFVLRPRLRHFFRMLDQVCIFFLIAGTYTPISLVYLREGWTGWIVVALWTMALAGALFRICFSYLESISSMVYVVLAWLPVMALPKILGRVPNEVLIWVLAGGLLYMAGTAFLARDQQYRYFHAVWHLFVVAAGACHYFAIYRLVVA
jgi:hemolysin III